MRAGPAVLVLAIAASACGRQAPTDAPTRADAALSQPADATFADTGPVTGMATAALPARDAGVVCTADPSFPSVLDVPEGSAAAEVTLRPGSRELLVVSDSDNRGAAVAYALPAGPERRLSLPLDPRVSDDIEGIAWYAGHLYALASTGYIERFRPNGKGGLARDAPAYGLGGAPYTTNARFLLGTPPDFEGLCLRPPGLRGRCAGYAASRAYGWLVCLQWSGERLRVDADHPRLALDLRKHSLSDCAFGDGQGPARGVLLVATNIYGGSTVYRVDEDTGALAAIDVEDTANDAAIAIDGDGRLVQVMDANSSTSPSVRATCTGW
jgi:hypothetical protein